MTDIVHEDSTVTILRKTVDGRNVWIKEFNDPFAATNEAFCLLSLLENPDPRMIPYLPSAPKQVGSHVLEFEEPEGFYSFKRVLEAYPDGLDPRDMAWMYRRLLVILGFVHQVGFVHGQVLPHNVLIHPEKHGLILVGWEHAVEHLLPDIVEHGGLDPVEVTKLDEYKDWYPPEDWTFPEWDIYMAALNAVVLCGANPADLMAPFEIDKEYRSFFAGSLKPRYRDRLHDPWKVLEYFDLLLAKLYGPRKFRPFSMPKGT